MKFTYRKYQKRAKLVGLAGGEVLWLLNEHDEWIHDVYEESDIHHGVIYSLHQSFHPKSTSITGYFKDTDTGCWIKVEKGAAALKATVGWMESLEELIQADSLERG
ncbi:molecular chaperone GrpE [Ammoniphilus sp. CFH 90114]|uniref:molecular chaperone GrpE n=1 Tax=Ammoniphilus sp. CFH 90114 TaxID=2493665 RepID=UPI00100DCA2F|nr:molecular chaperone GrpE [Ammoniphilus sp. CFH 90114]RXT07257.1 molecular chaperone GrpE [Ammoniphilus sp. CFH 90114]